MFQKIAYVCGPLTELKTEEKTRVKSFYQRIGDACGEITGLRAFVPHEHFDPIKHAHFTPQQVDETERNQVCNKTSVLIVVAIAPSWGGGIEVEMANQNNVPVILLCEREKLQARQISRLLRGNPAAKVIIEYDTEDEAILELKKAIGSLVQEIKLFV
jgi:hypothetical protein